MGGVATYVLVPGAWLGAWAWQDVARDLRGRGHDVHPVSLTGMGDRVHLARPDVDLDTHLADVVNLLAYEDLREVVLVGHSRAVSFAVRDAGSEARLTALAERLSEPPSAEPERPTRRR